MERPQKQYKKMYGRSRPAQQAVYMDPNRPIQPHAVPQWLGGIAPPPGVVYRAPGGSVQETKYFDTSFSQTVASAGDWTGTEVPCTNYIQSDGTTVGAYTDSALIPSAVGAGYGQIVGAAYNLKKIRCRGVVLPAVVSDGADVPVSSIVRLSLVMDFQPNGAQAQGEDVFPDMGTAQQCNFSFLAMGAGSAGRFRILHEEVFISDPTVAATDGASTNSSSRGAICFSFSYRPKQPIVVRIKANSSTPTVASLTTHNIFLLAHSNGTTNVISGVARAYYQG